MGPLEAVPVPDPPPREPRSKVRNKPKAPPPDRLRPHLYKPGQSGNPAGRPPGLVSMIRQKTREGRDMVDLMLKVLRGEIRATTNDRIRAAEWLAARGFGATMPGAALGAHDRPGAVQYDLSSLKEEELKTLEDLIRKLSAPAPVEGTGGAVPPEPPPVRP